MNKRLKNVLNRFLAYLGNGREMVKNIYRRLRYEKRNLLLRIRLIFQKYNIPDPDHIYWLDPKRVVYHTNFVKTNKSAIRNRVFDMVKDKGRVYAGDWDLSNYRFSDMDVYKSLEQRILQATSWDETIFYKNALSKIESNQTPWWGCYNLEDLKKRCSYLDSLIQNILEKGYVFLHQLTLPQGALKPFLRREMADEITVNISRSGQYLFQNGRHRLAIAKILGLNKIPTKVLVRHKEWHDLREELTSMARLNRDVTGSSSELDQPAVHPDLIDIPASNLCEDRFLAIKECLKSTSGSVLNIGSNLAYFCHKFEDIGFDCYAIETDPNIAELANKIRVAEEKKFKIFCGSILDPKIQDQILRKQFDIVLAFDIFHHFLKTESSFIQLKQFLSRLCLKIMYFNSHLYNEGQVRASYQHFSEDEFVHFILANTTLNHFEVFHEAAGGRHTYRLY